VILGDLVKAIEVLWR